MEKKKAHHSKEKEMKHEHHKEEKKTAMKPKMAHHKGK
jgi:hypothetical protein